MTHEPSTARDVYSIVTNKVIALLEKGTVPWKQSWSNAGLPQNLLTKKAYRGINVWLLASLQYPVNSFLTAHQVREIGGGIIPGQQSHMVVFWKWKDSNKQDKDEDVENVHETDKPILRYYKVYNVAQCVGIPEYLLPTVKAPYKPLDECEKIYNNMINPPLVVYQAPKPYYNRILDVINMPISLSFKTVEDYYDTFFHELIHSTGHESRTNRLKRYQGNYGKEEYAFEELVAELGAAFLNSFTGIADSLLPANASYIQSWLERLQNDRKLIIMAAAHSQKACDYILTYTH